MIGTTVERFWPKVKKTKTCWSWVAGRDTNGYGVFWEKPKFTRAHVFSYKLFKGKIPNNLIIDHLCRNRSCCNPAHLEAVTHRENCLRGESFCAKNARKTHCPKGHELSGYNAYPTRGGKSKQCRECLRQCGKKWRDKNRDVINLKYRIWRRKNRDLVNAEEREYRRKNKDRINEKRRLWRKSRNGKLCGPSL